MTRRYDFQDVLDRFASSQSQRFRELSDAIARRVLELLGGGTVPNDPPGAPSGLTASTDQEFRVVLDWSPVAGATGYNVYRAPLGGTSFAQIGVASTSDYIDVGLPAETSYRYYVTAYNSSGESGPSSTEIGTTADGAAPPLPDVPANFQVLDSVDTVTLGWDAFTGGTVLCRIERSSNQTDWTVVANTGSVTFNDANVTVGATLYYRAYGVSATGVSSVSTPTLTVVVSDGDTTAPPVPVITNTTTANKAIFVEWESVVASDLAGYEIGYGTSSGVYTNTTPLLTGSSAFVTGLTNATQYYFAIRSVDSSLNQNKSAWSNEKFNIPIDQAFPITPEGPGAPTDLVFSSPERNQVRVNFTAGATESPRRHRLYARVKPGYLINGAPPTTAWTQIDQEPHPATVLGKDATIFVGSNSFEQSPVVWQFYVTAVDTYNQESSPSEIVEGQLDGAAWNQGPGSGPIAGGNFNGDQLTPEHRVPGYTFDYVIDVSDPAAYTGDAMERAAAIFNNRRGLAPTNPDYLQLSTTDRARIAVLLPNETVNRRLEINTGVTGNADIEVAEFDFGGDPGFESLVDLHFVAPWDDANATVVEAQAAMRDDPLNFTLGYKRTFKNADNTSKFADGQGYNIKIGDSTRRNAKVDMWFWNWDIEVSGESGVLAGLNADTGADFKSHDFWVGFGLCRFHQDNVLPNNSRIGSHAIDARYAKIELGGTYIDMPWQDSSAVRCLSTMRGSFGITNVRVRRSGGSAFEFFTRGSRDSGLPAGTSAGTLTITGLRHWDEKPGLIGGVGRATLQGAPFFDFGSLEQEVIMTDCEVVEEIPTNFRSPGAWPPPDPYDWRIYTDAVNLTNPIIKVQARGGDRSTNLGYKRGAFTIQNSLLYSRNPVEPVVDLADGVDFTLSNVGIYTAEPGDVVGYVGQSAITVGTTNRTLRFGAAGKPANTPHTIGAASATGLNVAAHTTSLVNDYGIADPANIAAGLLGVVIGDYTIDAVEHFDITDTFSFSEYVGPTVPYLSPLTISPDWPSVATIDAISMYDQNLTRAAAKNVIVPQMLASRAPRTMAEGQDLSVRRWAYKPGEGFGATDDFEIYFGSHLSGPSTNEFVTWEDNHTTLKVENFEFRHAGVQRPIMSHYPEAKGDESRMVESFVNRNPRVTSEWVFPKEEHDRWGAPGGCRWVFNNISIYDHADRRRYARPGIDEGSQVKWLMRMNQIEDITVTDSDFAYVHQEHGNYLNSEGPVRYENCTFRYCGGQGHQIVNRSDSWGQNLDTHPSSQAPEDSQYLSTNHNREFINTHWIDVGNWSNQAQNKSSVVNLYSSGYPENPCELIEFRDCSMVCGLTTTESSQERAAAGDPDTSPYINRNGAASSASSMVAAIVESQSGLNEPSEFREGSSGSGISTELFKTPYATVAAGRADGAATTIKVIKFTNCYFRQMDAANPMFRFDSAHTIIFEDCVFIHDEVYGTNQRPFNIDSGLWAYGDPGSINYMENADLHGTHHLIFRNCRGEMRDAQGNFDGNMTFRWDSPDVEGEYSFGSLDFQPDQELHFQGYQEGRSAGQVSTPIYSGPVRPGFMP